VLLGILIGTAILWTFEIQNLVRTYGTLAYSTFGLTGDDKNSIGFVLALAGIVLFYLAVFWKPTKPMPKSPLFLLRLVLGLAGLYFFYNMFLIYARSALLLALMGMGAILVVMFIKSPGKSRFLRVALIAAALILAGFLALPKVLAISPRWIDMAANFQMAGVDAFPHRVILIQKGIFLISQNPFLGVGIGGSKASVSSSSNFFPGFWIHNLYLTDWAEKGVLGLLSYVVWILAYLKIVRTKFLDLPLIDQVWLVLLMLLFLEMLFLDINTVSYIMLGILTGIYYEQYLVEQANKTRSNLGA
jgi:O-antigen ligase